MKLPIALALCLCLPCCLLAQGERSGSLLITHVTVIDMTGAPPKRDMTVVVTGDRITGIHRRTRIPSGAKVVDATGKYLIPGLWDMHVHFTEIERSFPMFIANGITGVRNMGGDLKDLLRWRAEVTSGRVIGPRIVTCGPIVDGPQPAAHGPTMIVATAAQGHEAVLNLKRDGADCVKVYDRLPREAYFAIIEEAKRQQIPVVGHVPLSLTSLEASDAGQRSFEHLGSILESCSSLGADLFKSESSSAMPKDLSEFPRRIAARGERMLQTYDERRAHLVFARLARNKTWQVPTLEVKWTQSYIDDLSRVSDPRMKYIPESVRQWWTPQQNFFARYRTPEYISYKKKLFEKELALVGALHQARVPFMTGTDLSGAYIFAGFSLHHELELFVRAGFTPMEALQAATRNPAVFLNEQDSLGTVTRGKIANLVLLDANPLEDIRNTQRINAVVLKGRYLSKEELQRLLAKAEAAASN